MQSRGAKAKTETAERRKEKTLAGRLPVSATMERKSAWCTGARGEGSHAHTKKDAHAAPQTRAVDSDAHVHNAADTAHRKRACARVHHVTNDAYIPVH